MLMNFIYCLPKSCGIGILFEKCVWRGGGVCGLWAGNIWNGGDFLDFIFF